MFGGVAQQVLFRGPGAKIANFGDSEDVPEARGCLRTSVALPANSAPDPVTCRHLFVIKCA